MTEEQQTQKKEDSPWGTVATGAIMIAGAIFLYYTFDDMEKEGGSVRLNIIFALLYKLGGKWVAPVLLSILGAFTINIGVKDIIKKNRRLAKKNSKM